MLDKIKRKLTMEKKQKKTLGALGETSPQQRQWRDTWPGTMQDYHDVYEQVSVVRKCINLLSDFTISTGWIVDSEHEDLKERIEDMQKRTNFAEMLKKAEKNRQIWGFAAFEIVRDGEGEITSFNPLRPQNLRVRIDAETMEISNFEYRAGTTRYDLEPEKVFYVTLDALDASQMGVSSLESIKTTIKRKWNLEKDLEQAAIRLWAPFAVFKYNTEHMVEDEEQERQIREDMQRFAAQIEPGKTIVHNQKIEPTIIDMSPNINALNQAIESADQEILGNYGVPRALLSREGTTSRGALEFSIKAMYESSVLSIQQYYKFEIGRQIYDLIAEEMDYSRGSAEHKWRPPKFHDSTLIRALSYAVKEGIIKPSEMITMLGWPLKMLPDVDEDREPDERVPPDERMPTMSLQDIEMLLEEKLDEHFDNNTGV